MKIESPKGISSFTPLKSINNNTKAYMLRVPRHINVKKSYDSTHHDLIWINSFGLKFECGKTITGYEDLGKIEHISDIGNNNFIISFKDENSE